MCIDVIWIYCTVSSLDEMLENEHLAPTSNPQIPISSRIIDTYRHKTRDASLCVPGPELQLTVPPGPRFHVESLLDPGSENKLTPEAQGFSVASLHDLRLEQPAHPRSPRFCNLHQRLKIVRKMGEHLPASQSGPWFQHCMATSRFFKPFIW